MKVRLISFPEVLGEMMEIFKIRAGGQAGQGSQAPSKLVPQGCAAFRPSRVPLSRSCRPAQGTPHGASALAAEGLGVKPSDPDATVLIEGHLAGRL